MVMCMTFMPVPASGESHSLFSAKNKHSLWNVDLYGNCSHFPSTNPFYNIVVSIYTGNEGKVNYWHHCSCACIIAGKSFVFCDFFLWVNLSLMLIMLYFEHCRY